MLEYMVGVITTKVMEHHGQHWFSHSSRQIACVTSCAEIVTSEVIVVMNLDPVTEVETSGAEITTVRCFMLVNFNFHQVTHCQVSVVRVPPMHLLGLAFKVTHELNHTVFTVKACVRAGSALRSQQQRPSTNGHVDLKN